MIGRVLALGGAALIPPDNVRRSPYGNSRRYTLARLERDHPALYARVLAGELSAHRAAILAGFRKERRPIARALDALAKLTEVEWQAVAKWRNSVRRG